MSTHKSSHYKLTAVKYFLDNNVSQLDTCKIFNCNPRSLMRWVNKYKTTNDFISFPGYVGARGSPPYLGKPYYIFS